MRTPRERDDVRRAWVESGLPRNPDGGYLPCTFDWGMEPISADVLAAAAADEPVVEGQVDYLDPDALCSAYLTVGDLLTPKYATLRRWQRAYREVEEAGCPLRGMSLKGSLVERIARLKATLVAFCASAGIDARLGERFPSDVDHHRLIRFKPSTCHQVYRINPAAGMVNDDNDYFDDGYYSRVGSFSSK